MNEDRLRQHLADKASGVEVTPGDLESLRSRSPNPLVIMGAGLALVTVLGAGLAWLLPAGDGAVVATETTLPDDEASDTEVAISESSVRAPGSISNLPVFSASEGPKLTWQGGDFLEGGFVNGIIAVDDGFLAWGQEPFVGAVDEEAEFNPAWLLWRSGDGLEWTEITAKGLADEPNTWVADLLATDDRLIAVGVVWDQPDREGDTVFQPDSERTVLWTSVGGETWDKIEFPGFDGGPTENPGEYWSGSQPLLAAQGDLVVLLVAQTLDFDPYYVIEERLAGEGLEIGGIGMSGDRIDVYGPGPGDEIIASYTAEELGVDPNFFDYGGPIDTRATVYVSTDGGVSFEERAPVGLEGVAYADSIFTIDGKFVISAEMADFDQSQFVGPGQASWTSSDGITWIKADPIGDGWLNNLDSYGDLVVGSGENLIVSFDGGATFSRMTGPAFEGVDGVSFFVERVSTGPFGTIATGSAFQEGPPPRPLEVEVDGYIYRETYPQDFSGGPSVTVTDVATGEVVFSKDDFWTPDYIDYGETGETITFISPETGDPIVTLTWQEFEEVPLGNGDPVATIEKDGLILTNDFESGHVVIVDSATGDVLFDVPDVFSPSYVDQDSEGFTILDPDTGEQIVHISYLDIDAAYSEEGFEGFEESFDEAEMWFSPDGVSWSRQSMADAFGDAGYPTGLVSGDDRVVVMFMPESAFYPESEEEARTFVPPPTQVWVGTLP